MRKIVTYRLIGFAIVCMFMLQAQSSIAQWTLDVMGTVKKEETKKRMEGATITIKRNGTVWKTVASLASGKFEASLLPGAVYVIEFSKPGHVTKRIEMSTKNVPPDDAKYGFDFPMEMVLFEKMDGLDVSILNQPIAKVAFNPETGYMDYDPAYTKSIKKELERLKQELAAKLKLLEAERKAKQKSYDVAIAAADKAFNVEKWAEAKSNYTEAAGIFPNETYPPKQLKEIKAQLDKKAADDKEYNNAIAKADAAFKEKAWEKSTAAYQSALNIKEQEQYPKDKIKEIQALVANAKKVDQQYNDAIALADQNLAKKDYESAKSDYQKASGIKPNEEYPKNKIKEIDNILAELNKKDKGYSDAITEGDNQFKANDYKSSITSYNKALGFKPGESYPKQKIEEANKLMADMKQLQENYDKLIANADAAFSTKDYDGAKQNYTQALNLKDTEKYPKDKLNEIESILAGLEQQESENKAKDAKYQKLIDEADKMFGYKKYEDAKGKFTEALSVKEKEPYPKKKIAEIDGLLADIAKQAGEKADKEKEAAELQAKYDAFISSADQNFSDKDYESAQTNYTNASDLKKGEKYPKDKLKEIEELLAEIARKKAEEEASQLAEGERDAKYQKAIALADNAFGSENYKQAKLKYNEATAIKSKEQYPKDKLKEIEKILAEMAKKNEEDELAAESERKKKEYFDALIAEADGELIGENYQEAEAKYNQALEVIPGEKYPQEKLQEIKDILAKLASNKANTASAKKELDERYNEMIAQADKAFGAKKYSSAKGKYEDALELKQQEYYPKDQLAKIKKLLAEIAAQEAEITLTNNALKQKQEQYNTYIKYADTELAGKRYGKSISFYEQALSIMPDKSYPKEKIEEINQLIATNAEKEKNNKAAALAEKEKRANYDRLIYEGDRAMKLRTYPKAQVKYKEALNLYADEKYPKGKLDEILEILNKQNEPKDEIVSDNTYSGARAKINTDKEKEIEAKMAALLGKRNIDNDKELQRKKDGYNQQEEIRVSGGISRTKEAGGQIDKYTDNIIAQTEKGNKYHIENNKSLIATKTLLEKAENNRVKDADKKRNKADKDLANYAKEEIAFKKEQEELSKDKMETHNIYVDNVNEAQIVMIEKGEKIREGNRKDIENLVAETEKNEKRNKKRRKDMEIDVHKYKASLQKEEEIRITASINRTTNNGEEIKEMADEMTKQQAEKSDHYKLNVKELMKFKDRIDKLETQRIKRADKARERNQKMKEKIIADFVKKAKWQDKKYYEDIELLGDYKESVAKYELANQKQADKRRVKSNRDVIAAKDELGVTPKSQDKRYKEFQDKLNQQRKSNSDFMSDLQTMEQEKILLANAELSDFYMGEKRLKQDTELAKQYPQGISEKTTESGNSIVITRTKVTGSQVDVYERVFYTWGGTFFYKNGVNITQSLWDKESID